MKKKIIAFLLACTLVFAAFPSTIMLAVEDEKVKTSSQQNEDNTFTLRYETAQAMLDEMKIVATDSSSELYLNEKSLVIAVKDKKTNKIFSSSPYNADNDEKCNGNVSKGMKSHLAVSYVDKQNISETLWSYDSSVMLNQFKIKKIQNGIEIAYVIGRDSQSTVFPEVLSEETYQKVAKNAKSTNKGALSIFYKKTDISKLNSSDKSAIKKKYKNVNDEIIYVALKMNDREMEQVEEIFKSADFDATDLKKEYENLGFVSNLQALPSFSLTTRYTLADGKMIAEILTDSIEYDTKNFILTSIKFLEYFGAEQAKENQEGYVFIPDGSGAIIDFNDKTDNRVPIISGDVYGIDSSLTYPEIPRQGKQFYLPVFGIKNSNAAVFAIIDKGAQISTISSSLGGLTSSYYTAFQTFAYTTQEELELEAKVTSHGSNKKTYVYDSNVYKGEMKVIYSFLFDNDASYSGMAKEYKKYLNKNGVEKNEDANKLKLTIETLGTVGYSDKFLGIPITSNAKLTTYSDNLEMLKYFKDNGITNIDLMLNGWQKDGLETSIANNIKLSNALGGKKDFKKLLNYCDENDVNYFTIADMLYVAKDKMFDGFSYKKDTSRLLNNKLSGLMPVRFDLGTYDKSNFLYTLSPSRYEKTFSGFIKHANKLGINNIALSNVGSHLNSDFKKGREINRTQSLDLILAQLEKISKNKKMSFDGANAYVLKYADSITCVPMQNSGFRGQTHSVPFVQMVLSGSISYATTPLNFDANIKSTLLDCVESRTSPYFIMALNDLDKLKRTTFSKYYNVNFDVIKQQAIESYKYVENALKATMGASIIDHKILAIGVSCTTYSNGVSVYVNKTESDFKLDDMVVEKSNYIVNE